jgi:hypothetical protein
MATVGTCSICGGRVSVPDIWMGIYPPIPQCDSCHAMQTQPHGPVVPMTPLQPLKKVERVGLGDFLITLKDKA